MTITLCDVYGHTWAWDWSTADPLDKAWVPPHCLICGVKNNPETIGRSKE